MQVFYLANKLLLSLKRKDSYQLGIAHTSDCTSQNQNNSTAKITSKPQGIFKLLESFRNTASVPLKISARNTIRS